MLRQPYLQRWLVLVTSVATATTLVVWLVQPSAGSTPPADPHAPAAATTSVEPTSAASITPADDPVALTSRAAGAGAVVSLTFDDGPDPRYTPRVLELLARHGATATFCMVGSQAMRHPDLVRQVVAAGMPLCAHSLQHDETLKDRPPAVIDADVAGAKAILVAAAGADVAVAWYRAPAGNWSDDITSAAARHGMRPLSWSVDSRDWALPGADAMATAVRDAIEPGAVVLFHDGGGRREQTIAVLETLLPWLVEQGYSFAPPA